MERFGEDYNGQRGGHLGDLTEDNPRTQQTDRVLCTLPRNRDHHHCGCERRCHLTHCFSWWVIQESVMLRCWASMVETVRVICCPGILMASKYSSDDVCYWLMFVFFTKKTILNKCDLIWFDNFNHFVFNLESVIITRFYQSDEATAFFRPIRPLVKYDIVTEHSYSTQQFSWNC